MRSFWHGIDRAGPSRLSDAAARGEPARPPEPSAEGFGTSAAELQSAEPQAASGLPHECRAQTPRQGLRLGGCALLLAIAAMGCGNEPSSASPTATATVVPTVTPTPTSLPRFDCTGFVIPARVDTATCDDVDAEQPETLRQCLRGSGHLGLWTVDASGLPAYDFTVEERCDPAAQAYSPRKTPLHDPIHVVGNGRGLVAMAHASGGVEIYTQDRGHKWINHVDTWADPLTPGYPPQLGGGFNYYTVIRDQAPPLVGSTRFEDLPVNRATEMQTRRFGVGYVETITRDAGITLRRRVFAPDAEARALIAQVTVENPTSQPLRSEIVEFWDVNIHEIPLELLTSDLGVPGITAAVDRRRRALMSQFTQRAQWRADEGIAVVETTAKDLPAGITDRFDVSNVDYFPDPIYLAVLDTGAAPDAVWLSDAELWDGNERTPPARAAEPGEAASRSLDLDGAGQHAILAIRVPVEVPAGGAVTRRFAFGYSPDGAPPEAAVADLRARAAALLDETAAAWAGRLVWAALPGLQDAGVVQREMAWSAYCALAGTTFDEYRHVRLLGQGGAYKYIHGIDGAMGDLALFAEALLLIDPDVARHTLVYALATQQAASEQTPWRFPYATTGVGAVSDVLIYDQRSDAYYFLPAAIGRYVAVTRDSGLLDRAVPFWPRAAGETGDVIEHIRRALQYGTETLGFGARGIVAMGTGDYADGINNLATGPATPTGTSSTYNAGAIVYGFPVAADVVETRDPALAGRIRDLTTSQANGLLNQAWEGNYFYRGFIDSGDPLAPQIFFLEPQVFPVLAGIVEPVRRDLALDEVVARLETSIGALSNVAISSGAPTGGGADRPLVGGIWPVANAWLTAAYARRSADEAWSSFIHNTLAAHAEKYPDLWYGIWTGPDSFNGPDNPRPGEADAHRVTALTDYPALNAHVHTGPLRALMDIIGVSGTVDGLRITPRVPTERFTVEWPRFKLQSTPNSIAGDFVASSDGPVVMRVALPSGLRGAAALRVTVDGAVVESTVTTDVVRFVLPGHAGSPVAWQIDLDTVPPGQGFHS